MSVAPRPEKVEKRGAVIMLPGAKRPEDALKFVHEAVARDPASRGIIVVEVDADGDARIRVFGEMTRGDVSWAANQLLDSALHD